MRNTSLGGWLCHHDGVARSAPRGLPVSNSASQSQHQTKSAGAAGQQRPQQALSLMIGSMVGMVQTGRHDRATHGWSNF